MKFILAGLFSAMLASSANADVIRPGCGQVDASNNCAQCYFRYVLKDGNCVAVSDQCKTWDNSTGDCTSCYDGWTLASGQCSVPGNGGSNNGGSSAPADPNCVESANGACTKCASRWYLSNGVCTAVSNQCNTWDENTGACTSCFDGWTLNAGQCQSAGQQSTSSDPNCNQSDANGVCTKCNFRWVLKNGTCSQLATNARLGTTQLELAHLATTAGLSQQANALFEIEMIIHTSILFPIN